MNAPVVVDNERVLELKRTLTIARRRVGELVHYADTVETKLLAMCVAAANNNGVVGDDLIVEALELVASNGSSEHARCCAREELGRHNKNGRKR